MNNLITTITYKNKFSLFFHEYNSIFRRFSHSYKYNTMHDETCGTILGIAYTTRLYIDIYMCGRFRRAAVIHIDVSLLGPSLLENTRGLTILES